MNKPRYKILRKYRDYTHPDHNKVIDTGLTLKQAQKHCTKKSTREPGVWFDCYVEDEDRGIRPSYFARSHEPGMIITASDFCYLASKQKGLGSLR